MLHSITMTDAELRTLHGVVVSAFIQTVDAEGTSSDRYRDLRSITGAVAKRVDLSNRNQGGNTTS